MNREEPRLSCLEMHKFRHEEMMFSFGSALENRLVALPFLLPSYAPWVLTYILSYITYLGQTRPISSDGALIRHL